MSKQFLKSSKINFLKVYLKIVKLTLSEGQNLTQNFDIRVNLSTFRAEVIWSSDINLSIQKYKQKLTFWDRK